MKTTKQFKVDTTDKIGGTLYMKPAEWAVLSLMVQNGIPLLPQCSWDTGDKILHEINKITSL